MNLSLWEGMLISFVPVVCELVILQVLYISMYKETATAKRRAVCLFLFFLVDYPIVFLTDYYDSFDTLYIVRLAGTLLLWALYLKAIFRGGFLSRCLPAAAVFAFLSLVLEMILWFLADAIGLEPVAIRFTTWQVLIFQAILYVLEYAAAKLVGKLNITAGYSDKMMRKMWLPTAGYLAVTTVFWIGLVNFLSARIPSGNFGITEIASILVCCIISLMFIKSGMDISRETDRRQRELADQKTELEYQKLYNSGMDAMMYEVSRFRHNYSNTLAALSGYADAGDYERLKDYIDELCRKQQIALAANREALAQIKNGAVAGLLAAKMLAAEKSEVVFKLSVNGGLNSVNMPLMELCEVLGILLDNAVEAAAESAGKYLRVEIDAAESGKAEAGAADAGLDEAGAEVTGTAGSSVVFRIENSVDKKPDVPRLFEKGYTTKEGGSGIGLHIAETILKKNPASSLDTFADDERVIQELSVM